MSKPSDLLSDTKLRKSKPKVKEYTLSDGRTGLVARFFPSGRISFCWRYVDKFKDGKMSRVEYGDYPDRSLSEARQIHIQAKSARKNGKDVKNPSVYSEIVKSVSGFAPKIRSDTKDESCVYSVNSLVSDYWKYHVDPKIKDKKPYKTRIKKHFSMYFGEKDANNISTEDNRNKIKTLE